MKVILQTEDGGRSWRRLRGVLEKSIIAVPFFLNELEGWLVGEGEVVHTSDGGGSWRPLEGKGLPEDMRPWDVLFFNPKEGFILGGVPRDKGWERRLWRTDDGGRSWRSQPVEGSSLAFPSEKVGWIAGAAASVWRSEDGGRSWARQMERGFNYKDVFFLPTGLGWIVGQTG